MNHFFDILLVVFGAAYLIEFIILRIGIRKASSVPTAKGYEPTVSIIVAARNEENFIGSCLNSLLEVDYPVEKLEIIAVNDHSSDRTAEIIAGLSSRFPRIKLVSTNQEKGNLRGKTNAVAAGIAVSKGEILMFTDADCIVPKDWVCETVKYFTPETGIVGGYTLLDSHGPFEEMQTLDWVALFNTAAATAGWNIPLTAIGNNLSIRRTAYEQTGGFEKIPFSVTEDYAIVRAILAKTPFRISFPLNPRTMVKSNPCKTWNQLYRQKQRWGVGGLDVIPLGFFVMAITWALKSLLLLGVFFATLPVWIGVFLLKCAADCYYLWKPLRRLNALYYLRSILFFEIYFTLYVVIIPFIALFSKRVVWKERSL
jgi:cellulose synthase/poly-beta-1,6-N-acetylglucosamine synthase-like glycosyltransferase